MTSVNAFNQTLQEFLNELSEMFPDDQTIIIQKEKLGLNTSSNDSNIALDSVMPILAKYATIITSKDENSLNLINEAFPEIDLVKLWNSNLSENTKKTIWEYLNTLLMLGTTIKTIPTNMLSEIEKIAQNCVSQMQQNNTQPDQVFVEAQKAIFDSGMLQNMMGNLGGQLPPNLLGQTPKNTPRINSKSKTKKGKKK